MQPSQKQSKIIPDLYSEEYLQESFGSLTPSIEERTLRTFNSWVAWRNTELVISPNVPPWKIRKVVNQRGLRYFEDYIISNNRIRFRDKSQAGLMLLVLGEKVSC